MISNEKRSLIAEIATADTLIESISIFNQTQDLLEDCKFIFASEKGATPGLSVKFDFQDGSAIRSLFNTENVLVLDKETFKEMLTGNAHFQIDYSISLDTQALSYLEPYINGFENKLPNDYKDIFSFICRDDVFVDALPYVYENYQNIHKPNAPEKIFNKLKAYEILRTLDKFAFENESIIKSKCTDAELIKKTQEHIARMYLDMTNNNFIETLNVRFNNQYAYLLKMISIQLKNPKRSTNSKIIEFLDFCHKDVSFIGLRETLVANAFFKHGQKFKFFSKIQKNKKDIFDIIKGMAWDLFHIRQMEFLATIRTNKSARYNFPAFLTCDKRLIDIIDLYPMKCLAYIESNHEPMPFFDVDILQSLSDNLDKQHEIYNNYFSPDKVEIRSNNRELSTNKLKELVKDLEVELSLVANVELLC
ncbi:TPA: hypothetical protein ACX6QR_000799 [Photobacterium damselae]